MSTPKLQNVAFGTLIPNIENYRSANEYFPKGENERIGMGNGIIAGGISAMSPIRISKRVKDKVESFIVIGGNRRYWAIESQDAKVLSELKVPCLVYSGLTEVEELEISMSDNEGFVAISPWGNCKVVERLSKLGKSQSDIATRFNWSASQVGNLLLLTKVEPWIRTAGESGKIAASLVWQLYNSCKGKRDEKIASLNTLLASKRETIEGQGVTAKDFGVKETEEAKSAEIFNACVSQKAQELATKLLADKEVADQAKVYKATYEICDKSIKELIKLDKVTGDLFFAEFTAATAPLEGAKTLELYKAITGTLVQLNERTETKVKEIKALQDQLLRDELLAKEQANTITPEERAQLVTLAQPKVDIKGTPSLPTKTNDTSTGQGQGKTPESVQEDSFMVAVTMFTTNLILLCDKAIVTEKKTPGQVLDSLRATVRKACHNFQAKHELVS